VNLPSKRVFFRGSLACSYIYGKVPRVGGWKKEGRGGGAQVSNDMGVRDMRRTSWSRIGVSN
jgi:hypothetical protein